MNTTFPANLADWDFNTEDSSTALTSYQDVLLMGIKAEREARQHVKDRYVI